MAITFPGGKLVAVEISLSQKERRHVLAICTHRDFDRLPSHPDTALGNALERLRHDAKALTQAQAEAMASYLEGETDQRSTAIAMSLREDVARAWEEERR